MVADPSRQVGLKKFHHRWVPHALSMNQESERGSKSNLPLPALTKHKPIDFERGMAGDESWFFLD
jgi:hypothetical protein